MKLSTNTASSPVGAFREGFQEGFARGARFYEIVGRGILAALRRMLRRRSARPMPEQPASVDVSAPTAHVPFDTGTVTPELVHIEPVGNGQGLVTFLLGDLRLKVRTALRNPSREDIDQAYQTKLCAPEFDRTPFEQLPAGPRLRGYEFLAVLQIRRATNEAVYKRPH